MKDFRFDEKEHKYYLEGKQLVGVTTCLQVINPVTFTDDGQVSSKTSLLMNWAVKICVEEFAKRIDEYKEAEDKLLFLKEIKATHRKEKELAGNYGTYVHKLIEDKLNGKEIELTEEAERQVNFALEALKDYKVIRTEAKVYSEKHMFAGTFDLLIQKDGKYYLADFKTSKSIYDIYFVQMGGYEIAVIEMAPHVKIEGYIIIHISKDGKCSVVTNEERNITQEQAKETFMSALTIYRNTYNWGKK